MGKIVWLSDIHVDHASSGAITSLYSEISQEAPDYILVTGDTSQASRFRNDLITLATECGTDLLFVAGAEYGSPKIQRVIEY